MTEFKRALKLFSALTIALVLLSVPAQTREGTNVPLDRQMDQVVIAGKDFKKARDHAIANLRLMAFTGGSLKAVPFQIDEKTPDGDYVMKRTDGSVDKDNGLFDSNDELVFMAKDSGGKGDPGSSGISAESWDEIRLRDPKTGETGWAYLVAFAQDPPALSPIKYMKYEQKAGHDELTSPYYTLHFPKGDVFIRNIMIHTSAGGNGKDFMDRIKMRLGVSVLGGAVSIDRTEEDFANKVLGIIVGPVRIIRQTETRLVLIFSLKSPAAIVNGSFYPSKFEFPSMLSLPFRMDLVASDAFLRQGWDLNKNAIGMKFYSNLCPGGVTFDGKMSPEETRLAQGKGTLLWSMCSGPQGTFIFRGAWDMSSPIKALLYYEDDRTRLEPPENEPGVMGFAYMIEDLLKMGGEEYPFNIENYVVPNYDGDIERALRVFDHPLEFKINP